MEVISLSLAKRFKEAGIERPSKWVWSNWRGEREVVYKDPMRTPIKWWVPAYTAEELWAKLPNRFLRICSFYRKWEWTIIDWRMEWIWEVRKWPTLAEALGEMYLYLFTNWIWKK